MSSTRSFLIGTVWNYLQKSFGNIATALNVNKTIGNLTINDTHTSKNITVLNITSDFEGDIAFNTSFPFYLNNTNIDGNDSRTLQVNVTTPSTEGSTLITFNISVNDTDANVASVPASATFTANIVATSANPFLITSFETAPSIVSQNNTGIQLIVSVTNKGQGNAKNVEMNFSLPNGWINTTGTLSRSVGTLSVNEQNNFTLTVDINSTATPGTVTLYANVTGLNNTDSNLTSNLIEVGSKNVTVNEVDVGSGPAATVVESGGSESGGGGGGGSSGGGSATIYSKEIRIVRGQEDSFEIEVENKFTDTILKDLKLEISGFFAQYIEINPKTIDSIDSKDKKYFNVKIKIPAYKEEREVHTLRADVTGIKLTKGIETSYKETQNIKLIIEEVGDEEITDFVDKAKRALEEMKEALFNVEIVEELIKEINENLGEDNKFALDIAKRIIKIKDKAFEVKELIDNLKLALEDPKKTNLITGNVAKEVRDEDGKMVPVRALISGKAIFADSSIEEVVDLAQVAFERGDYDLAEERAKSAQVMLLLERRGNVGLFLYLYWYFVVIGVIIFTFLSIMGVKQYQKTSISRKIEDGIKEEANIRGLFRKTQAKYYSGKMSSEEFESAMDNHRDKLAKLRKARVELRNKRIKLLAPAEIINDLEIEKKQLEHQVKTLQTDYFVKHNISQKEYDAEFKEMNERFAEIEDDRITLSLSKNKNRGKVIEDIPEKKWVEKRLEKKKIVKKNKEALGDQLPDSKPSLSERAGSKLNKLGNSAKSLFAKSKDKATKLAKKMKKDERGVMMIDNEIIERLKEQSKDQDYKGKWIELKYKEDADEI